MADIIQSEYPKPSDPYAIWPVRHQWAESLTFSIEFKTDIITSSDGTEQRRAVRNTARFAQTISVVLDWGSKLALEDAFTRRQVEGMIVPLDFLPLYAKEALAPTELNLNITNNIADPSVAPFWLEAGDRVVLADPDDYWRRETREINTISATVAKFTDANLSEFPRQSYIWPARIAVISPSQAIQLLSSRVGTASSVNIQFSPADFQTIPETGTPFFVGTQEFFTPTPNYGGEAELDFIWPYNLLDYGYGQFTIDKQVKFPSRLYKFEYVFETVEEAFEIIGFFQRRRGMCEHFFFTTWQDDIKVRSITGGGTNIVVDGQRLGATYHSEPANTVFRRILVQYDDGTSTHHRIESVDELPETFSSVVRLQDELPTGIHPSDIQRVSWVLNGRFAMDRLDCEFMTAGTGRIILPIQSLRNAEL